MGKRFVCEPVQGPEGYFPFFQHAALALKKPPQPPSVNENRAPGTAKAGQRE
jgi:hypothetical protein